jgi:uncharacterized protein (UPF0276 family)
VLSGVGIGYRRTLAADLLARPKVADFVEVIAEACEPAEERSEVRAFAELAPVLVHGTKLSLGSAEGIDNARARRLGKLARDLKSPLVSEHAAFVRAAGREIGHLTMLPLVEDSIRVLSRNVRNARRHLPDVPLLLENIAWSFRWQEDRMDEGSFYAQLAKTTGCDLLLDIANLYANAVNGGRDPIEELDRFPLERVSLLHIAGGVFEDGFLLDTHSQPVPEAIFALVERVLQRAGDVPIVLERDANFPAFEELEVELGRARQAMRSASPRPRTRRPSPRPASEPVDTGWLQQAQACFAQALTNDRSLKGVEGGPDLARARSILHRRRIDFALRLLPRLADDREQVVAVCLPQLPTLPLARAHAAISDAIRIAHAAARESNLAPAAELDRMVIEAHFVVSADGHVRPRWGPFLRRAGRSGAWITKGVGVDARVRIVRFGNVPPC